MLQSKYWTEQDLKDFGFRSLGTNVRISSDARVYGPENISIGNNVRIDDFTILSAVHGSIAIGNQVFIARSSHLSGFSGIQIADFTTMAAGTIIYSASDDYSGEYLTGQSIPQKYTAHIGGPVRIERHTILGTGCTVLGPCTLGEGVSVGSMSLVRQDLEPWSVYAGVPARRLKDRKKGLLELEKAFLQEQSSC